MALDGKSTVTHQDLQALYLTCFHLWSQSPLSSYSTGYFIGLGILCTCCFFYLESFSSIFIQSVSLFLLDFYSNILFFVGISLIIRFKLANPSLLPSPFPCFIFLHKIHGCLVHLLSHVQLFVTSWTTACQASLSFTISQSLLKLMSIESVMPSNHLILCCPLLLLPSIFPSIRVFSNWSVLHIKWPKYWSLSF